MDNYQLSTETACKLFLSYDQEKIISSWELRHDADWIYTKLFDTEYRIDRHSGKVERCPDGMTMGYNVSLSIFDLLCHEGADKHPAGSFSPVNSLNGAGGNIGVDMHIKAADMFDADPEGFKRACEALGARPVALGDMAYRFEIFSGLDLILKFYFADDEFPASLTVLWDDNTLNYMFYETTFYVLSILMTKLLKKMSMAAPGDR